MGVKAAGRAGAVMKLILHDDVEGHDKTQRRQPDVTKPFRPMGLATVMLWCCAASLCLVVWVQGIRLLVGYGR